MKDDQVYTPGDCFMSFPFPQDWERNLHFELTGRSYYDFRAELMQRENKGLTAIYGLFNNPDCSSPGILRLRELHDAMDRAVLDAVN